MKLACALLLIAFVAGAMLRAAIPSDGTEVSPEGATEPAVSSTFPAGGALSTAASSVADLGPGVAGPESRDPESLCGEIERIIDALPAPDLPTGGEALEGVVIDPGRNPLPGIVVRVVPMEDHSQSWGPGQKQLVRDPGRRLIDRGTAYRWFHDEIREGVSGVDGRFRIEGLGAGIRRVLVPDETLAARVSVQGDPRSLAEPGEEVEVQVGVICDVAIEVLHADGTPAEKAKVLVDILQSEWTPGYVDFLASGELEREWSAASKILRVPSGWWEFSASVGDEHSDREAHWVHPDRVAPITLSLRPPESRGGIALAVRYPEQISPAELHVRWLALAPGEAPNQDRLLENAERQEIEPPVAATVAETGIRVPPGRYAIGVGRTWVEIEATSVVVVGDEWTEVALELPRKTRMDSFEVRVFGPDGAPLDADRLSLEAVEGEESHDLWLDSREIAEGAWSVAVDFERHHAAGRMLWVGAHSYPLGSRWALVDGPVVELRFVPAASLSVELAGWQDDGGAEVRLLTDGPGSIPPDDDEGNVLLFSPVQPGEARLEVRVAEQVVAALDGLRILPGENRVRIPVPPLSALEVEIPPDRLSWHFALVRIDPGAEISRQPLLPDRRGATLRFEGLVHGAYSLVGSEKDGMEAMRIDVAGNAHVSFDGHERTALLVRFRGEAPAGDGGLRDGDLVIGMEGEEFASPAEKDLLMMHLPEGGSPVRLLVERPGVGKVDVEVPADSLQLHFSGLRSGGAHLIEVPHE